MERFEVGHFTDRRGLTGCTVVLCPQGCRAGIDVRGSAPGSRETELLRPGNLVEAIHAVLLTGGSAFGLDAAAGVMRYLEERGAGFATPAGPVPLVVAAVLYDLDLGDPHARPDEQAGWAACEAAALDGELEQGSVGAGTGATVGKAFGPQRRMKGGLGVAYGRLAGGRAMAAVAAVNCVGDVYEWPGGKWLAGAWDREARRPVAAVPEAARGWPAGERAAGTAAEPARDPLLGPGQATTLACVLTDLPLTGADLTKVAQMAHDGLARAIRPAHTLWDGDTIVALSGGEGVLYDGGARALVVSEAGSLAADLVAQAIARGVRAAEGLGGVPAWRDLQG